MSTMDSNPDYQAAARALVAAFEVHDRLGLARASDAQREEQRQARMALLNYLTQLWLDLKRAGEHPADDPQYAPIAALCDLAGSPVEHAYT